MHGTISNLSTRRAQPRVFHTRLRNFAIQAERLIDPSLATCPIAIVSSPRQNGTILTLSHEAVEEGLSPGMRVSLARKMSRRVILLPPNASLYGKVQSILYRMLSRYSPLVEPAGYGRFFLDMRGMEGVFHSTGKAGRLLVDDISHQMNLTPRVGISRNKLVSSIATRVTPQEPVLEVPPGEEVQFLAPLQAMTLPISRERPVSQTLTDLNLAIIRDVQVLVNHDHLGRVAFGVHVRQVTAQAQGIDTSMVQPPHWQARAGRHVFERYTLPEDTNDEDRLHSAVQHLADTVGYQLRRLRAVAQHVQLLVHYTDGYENRACGRLPRHDAQAVARTLLDLYRRANRRRNRIRAITVDASRLQPYAHQMSLFDARGTNRQRIARQLDLIRERYGVASILTANQLCLEE